MPARLSSLTSSCVATVVGLAWLAAPAMSHAATPPCPPAWELPQLTIHRITNPSVPVVDTWQIFLGPAPVSDAQLALLAGNDPLIERTNSEMQSRGMWVYLGMGLAAAGTAISSVGWVLYGQNQVQQSITLPMAVGGLLLGVAGILTVSESIQSPLEPHIAPTPRHRLSRSEARRLIAAINSRIYQHTCAVVRQLQTDPRLALPALTLRPDAGSTALWPPAP